MNHSFYYTNLINLITICTAFQFYPATSSSYLYSFSTPVRKWEMLYRIHKRAFHLAKYQQSQKQQHHDYAATVQQSP